MGPRASQDLRSPSPIMAPAIALVVLLLYFFVVSLFLYLLFLVNLLIFDFCKLASIFTLSS